MLKVKNLFINANFNSNSDSSNYQVTPRLRRHIYYINQYKIPDIKYKKNFINSGIKQLNFDLLTIFYTVVTLGSLSKAAKHLAITQPAISLALRKIEKQIGVLIFRQVNSTTSLLLSPTGLILFNYIQRFFQVIDESQQFFNLNYSQTDLKNLKLLSVKKKKKQILSFSNLLIVKFLAKKDFLATIKFNYKYYENNAKIILLNNKLSISSKFFKLNYKNRLFKYILFNKIMSFRVLNKTLYNVLKKNNFVEIHTTNAYLTSLDMKISNNLYWGSEI